MTARSDMSGRQSASIGLESTAKEMKGRYLGIFALGFAPIAPAIGGALAISENFTMGF